MKSLMFVALTAVLIVSTADALSQPAPVPSATPTFPPAGMQFEKPFLDYLIPALRQTGKPARIYYAACPFPYLNFDLPEQGLTGMNAIRQMVPREPQVSVAQGRDGIIRITIGKVWTGILHTQIRRIALTAYEQYGAPSTILAILRSPEVRDMGKRLNLDTEPRMINIIVGGRINGAPHSLQ